MKGLAGKVTTADQAVSVITSCSRVFVGSGGAVPKELVHAMTRRHPELHDVEVYHILTLGTTEETAPYTLPGMEKAFVHYAYFVGKNTRQAENEGRAYFIPIFLHQVPAHIAAVGLDVALVMVSPPDKHGYCSLGISVDAVRAAVDSAKYVLAEINARMPRTLGDSFLHVDRITAAVSVDYDPIDLPRQESTPETERIAQNIANLVEDGATLQTGFGAIADAVLTKLESFRDLGVHTEMLSDGVMNLTEAGVITNARKRICRGKSVTAFVMGSQELYRWVHDNPAVEMFGVEFTNDPAVICQNPKVVAINGALQIDIKGQVCADSLGRRFYSGIGGQVDFMRGAAMSEGGKPIIALPSTARTPDGRLVSRIVPFLELGAGVVTSQGDVHYVVTEYGAASLHGKPLGQRAEELTKIAHPDYREALEREARESGFLIRKSYCIPVQV